MNQALTTQLFLNYFLDNILVTETNKNTTKGVDGIIGRKSSEAIDKAIEKIKNMYKEKNYTYNETINLLAFRLDDTVTDLTTDYFVVITKDRFIAVPCSTKAGKYWIQNPITHGGITGTAILVEGQYRQTWQFITANNWFNLWLQTPYFNQIKPVKIYRDGNKDLKVDRNVPVQEGLFGINIHTAGLNYVVWNWSAGCIVIPRMFWLELLPLFKPFEIYDFTLFKI
jgi:hypothetical protein